MALFSNSGSDVVFKRIKSRDTVQYLTVFKNDLIWIKVVLFFIQGTKFFLSVYANPQKQKHEFQNLDKLLQKNRKRF